MKKIQTLLIDDELALLHAIHFTLRRFGHEVTPVSDGTTAKQMLETAHAHNKPFDLLITDIQLPGMDGIEIIDVCRRLPVPTAILVITAYGTADLIKKLAIKGVRNILIKPFSMDDLIKQVKQVLHDKTQYME
jgi:CheY-like chemotaxis protein